MITIRCNYANGENRITRINATLSEAKQYYEGITFNIGTGENDNMQKCNKVELVIRENEIFKSYNKVQEMTCIYKYLGVDPTCVDTCYNVALQNVETNEIMHVENEWFNQRKISMD